MLIAKLHYGLKILFVSLTKLSDDSLKSQEPTLQFF